MKRLISLFLLVLGIAGAAAAQGNVMARAQSVTGDRFAYTTTTRAGAKVIAVKKPAQAMLDAIDRGLNDLIAVARKNGYRRKLNPSEYTIFIAKADRLKDSGGGYSPDIAVGAAQYAGSQYDQGGYVYAAGMVLSNNPCAFVIAEHTKDFNRVADLVRFEGEHLVLYHNDRRRYSQTADHSQGGGHPILQ